MPNSLNPKGSQLDAPRKRTSGGLEAAIPGAGSPRVGPAGHMAPKLRPASSGGPDSVAAVRDILLTHIDAATARLERGRLMADLDVHGARKSIKRARAILKLLRPTLAARSFALSKVNLRDAGRALSKVRDAKVIGERFDEMLQQADVPPSSISALTGSLHAAVAASGCRATTEPNDAATALANLAAARRRLARASLSALDWSPLGVGFRSIYRSGRRHMPGKADSGSVEVMHEWRKWVKSYWHALEVFAPVRPRQIGRTIRSVRHLADLLGEDHDLALLAERLRANHESPDEPVRALLNAVERRRRRLGWRAIRIGKATYAQPPAVMEKQLRHDWRKWRKDARATMK